MTELALLQVLLLVSVGVAPLGTRLFVPLPRLWFVAYALGVAAVAGALFVWPPLAVFWPLFCLGNLALVLRVRLPRSLPELAGAVPFAFSLVAATWIVGGTNDLQILGYGPHFSFYAALHGNVLGWMLVGALAALARREGRRLYVAAVLTCFVSFLLVALGIDVWAPLKPIGVAGLTLAIPTAQLAFLADARSNRAAFAAGLLSLVGLVLTLTLAWLNELGLLTLGPLGSVRAMVAIHGVVNVLLVGPAMLWAVHRHLRAVDAR
ncbi:MAG: YndJ family transporter [Myxococcales bacterium]|nr:YndJ family transporter [Myxococcales bacterium]